MHRQAVCILRENALLLFMLMSIECELGGKNNQINDEYEWMEFVLFDVTTMLINSMLHKSGS